LRKRRTGSMIRRTVGLVLMAGIALGVPVTWRIQGTFNDGGGLSGSFIYNADTNAVTNWDIVATAGSALGAFEYTPTNSPVAGASATKIIFASNQMFPAAAGTMQIRYLVLTFVSGLSNAGGTVLVNVALSGGDQPRECLNCAPARVFNPDSLV